LTDFHEAWYYLNAFSGYPVFIAFTVGLPKSVGKSLYESCDLYISGEKTVGLLFVLLLNAAGEALHMLPYVSGRSVNW
jgi:hypothetical protein